LNDNQIALIVFADSGERDNIVTNFDLNRDGVFGSNGPDRPVGIPRNSLRLPPYFNVDMRYSRILNIKESFDVEIYAEAENVFNVKSVSSYSNSVLTAARVDPFTGHLNGPLPAFSSESAIWRQARLVQIGAKLHF
jgi:hypothetical protein